jgi:hypothetical protein
MYTSFSNDDKSSMDSKTPPTFAPHINATGVQEDDLSEKKHENQDNSKDHYEQDERMAGDHQG